MLKSNLSWDMFILLGCGCSLLTVQGLLTRDATWGWHTSFFDLFFFWVFTFLYYVCYFTVVDKGLDCSVVSFSLIYHFTYVLFCLIIFSY